MRLPGGDDAVIDPGKILAYVLSPDHRLGRHKAKVFLSALGLGADHAAILIEGLRRAALEGEAVLTASDGFGLRYRVDFDLLHKERTARIRSAWLVPRDGNPTTFLTAFVL